MPTDPPSDLAARLREGLTPEVLMQADHAGDLATLSCSHEDFTRIYHAAQADVLVAALLPSLEARESAIRSEGQTCATCRYGTKVQISEGDGLRVRCTVFTRQNELLPLNMPEFGCNQHEPDPLA